MSRTRLFFLVITFGLGLCAPPSFGASPLSDRLRTFLDAESADIGGDSLLTRPSLIRFYEQRGFAPAWLAKGQPTSAAKALAEAIGDATRHGLTPADYHHAFLEEMLDPRPSQPLSEGEKVELDIALTDAALELGFHYAYGRVDPVTRMTQWSIPDPRINLPERLQSGLDSGDPVAALEALLPQQSAYWRLVGALAQLQALADAGGWPRVPDGPTLRPGSEDPRVPHLRRRLSVSGDLKTDASVTDDTVYDDALVAALRRFQERHGLTDDGVVGAKTLAALNVSAEARARQIAVNLERWRWLPADLGDRYVLVNIAGFSVKAMNDDQVVMRKRAVVGREYRQTPVFSDNITYIVVNPRWTVPRSIAVKDKLPLIKADPAYLSQRNYRVYQGWGAERKEVDPATVDWQNVSARNFSYTLVQEPGLANALGRVKMMFPNEHNVYLHDTPNPELFSLTRRTFSSGCIRVQDAMTLAAWLLGGSPSRDRLESIAATQDGERIIRLDTPVPVHMLYWTAWADNQGRLNLVEDIYNRDERVSAALN